MAFSKNQYLSSSIWIFIFIIGDMLCNGFADHSDKPLVYFACMGLQLASMLFTLFAILTLMWNTFLFNFGLLTVLCSRFQPVFLILPVYFALTLAFRLYRATLTTPLLMLYEDNAFQSLFYFHKLSMLDLFFYW